MSGTGVSAGPLAEFVGFTEEEVAALCKQYGRNLSELKEWYDGYHFEKARSIYSPRSVVTAILTGQHIRDKVSYQEKQDEHIDRCNN